MHTYTWNDIWAHASIDDLHSLFMLIITNTHTNNRDSAFTVLKFQSWPSGTFFSCCDGLYCFLYCFSLFIQCNIQYTANETTGLYAVALQIEDFASTADTLPLSSIPLQFIIEVYNSTAPCPSNQPKIVGGTRCVRVSSTYREHIVAQSGSWNIRFVVL